MRQFLFDGSDTAGIFTFDDVMDFPGKYQFLFVYDFAVFDDIDGNVMVDKGQDIQIQCVDITFHFQDIFFAHFIASGILDDGNCTVQLIQFEMVVDGKTLTGFDVIQHKALFDFSYI